MEGAHSLMCLLISGSLELPIFHISVLDVGEGEREEECVLDLENLISK